MNRESSAIHDFLRAAVTTPTGFKDAFKTMDKEIKDIVLEAAEFSQTSPEPDPSELWTDILVA